MTLAADYDFALPPGLIAQMPARPRDAARLLHVAGKLDDRHVRDLPGMLRPGDLLVSNDTRVIPAQLETVRGGARIGITLDQPRADGTWHALARNARRLRPGDTLEFSGDLTAIVRTRDEGSVTLQFDREGEAFSAALARAGALALPPYIERPDGPTAEDTQDYQTVFAAADGAVAAPTAGLHFTQRLLADLDRAGVARTTVTLHVGAGTFLPLRANTLDEHRMHAERGIVTEDAARQINAASRIIAVGTTSLRLLESAATDAGMQPFEGDTSLFIRPGHRFRTAQALLTNFHLPRSTLFVLVCAFAGLARMRDAYAHAIASGYRFYSYGDASLIER